MCDTYFWLSKNSNKSNLDQFYQKTLTKYIMQWNTTLQHAKIQSQIQLPDDSLGNLDSI